MFDNLMKSVSSATRIAPAKILSRCRKYPLAEARMVFAALAHKQGLTDELVGEYLKRSRVTVRHARVQAAAMAVNSRQFREKFDKACKIYESI